MLQTKPRSSFGQKTLPRDYFMSREIFRKERELIFRRSWLCVGHVSYLPASGSFFQYQMDHESVLVVRDRNHEIRAFHNVCRHRGTRLCEQRDGRFDGKIQCPYHSWTYSLDGRLLGAPNMKDAVNFQTADYPLTYVPTVVWEGLIFIHLSENPENFEEVHSSILYRFTEWQIPSLRMVDRKIYDIKANWKLIFQNYSECYHCPTVHPLLASLTPYKRSFNCLEEGPFLGGPMELGGSTESMTMDGKLCAAPLDSLCGNNQKLVHYYTLFPSLFLTLHPDYVMIHRAEPVHFNRTRVICEFYFHPSAMEQPGFDPQKAVEFWDITNKQDWHVCELSQQGIASRGYRPGPYSNMESLLAAFDREYLRIMNPSL